MPKNGFVEGRVPWQSTEVAECKARAMSDPLSRALQGWEIKGAQTIKEQSSASLLVLNMEIRGILGSMSYS